MPGAFGRRRRRQSERDSKVAHAASWRTWLIPPTMSDPGRILLQKSFWGAERKFREPLVRFARGDVRDHIG
jgi:hypothetical protein